MGVALRATEARPRGVHLIGPSRFAGFRVMCIREKLKTKINYEEKDNNKQA